MCGVGPWGGGVGAVEGSTLSMAGCVTTRVSVLSVSCACVCLVDTSSALLLAEPAMGKAAAASLSWGRDPGCWAGLQQMGGGVLGKGVLGWGCWRRRPLLTSLNSHTAGRIWSSFEHSRDYMSIILMRWGTDALIMCPQGYICNPAPTALGGHPNRSCARKSWVNCNDWTGEKRCIQNVRRRKWLSCRPSNRVCPLTDDKRGSPECVQDLLQVTDHPQLSNRQWCWL